MRIPITKPVFQQEEFEAILKPLEAGWVVQGPQVEQFEKKVARFVGAPFSVATSSCTTALHLAVVALGLKPGDEVIVPAFTWIATANVIEYMGAKPVFCDIDLNTFNLDVQRLPQVISRKTVGIIPVHLFGLPADMHAIGHFAEKNGLWVIEDCACALGSKIGDQHVGLFGQCGCFSFHPRKCITTGEGGMIVTRRQGIAEKAKILRNHGASVSDFARHSGKNAFRMADFNVLGYNYRMTDLQGALGAAQMDRLNWVLLERNHRAQKYQELLNNLDWIKLPSMPDGCTHSFQSFVCLFQLQEAALMKAEKMHEGRNALLAELENKGISTRPGTHIVPLQGYYRKKYGYKPSDYPSAYLADRLSFALPLYPQMTDEEQNYVYEAIKAFQPQISVFFKS